jgi:protein-disulfide isomerase
MSGYISAAVISATVALGTTYFMTKSETKGTFTDAQKQEIQKTLLDFLREKPDAFIGAVNEGVQNQQDKLRADIEKNANSAKDTLFTSGIALGNAQADVRFASFIDPMCPHCHEYMKLAFSLLQKRQDFTMNLIPVAILGPNSVAVGRTMIAASLQGVEKFKTFMEKFIDKAADLDRAKLLVLAKESGLDVAKLEKDEASEATEKALTENVRLFDSLKTSAVPTVFGGKKLGNLIIIPPMDLDNFSKLIDSIREDKHQSAPAGTTAAAGTVSAGTTTSTASAGTGTPEVTKDGK